MAIILLISTALLLAGFGLLLFFSWRRISKGRVWGSFDMTLFRIKVPKYKEKKEKKEDRVEVISRMEQIYSHFLQLKKPGFFERIIYGYPRVALEIVSEVNKEEVSFYISVPSSLEHGFSKYIHGVYPEMTVERVPEDYTIFQAKGSVAGSYLKLRSNYFFPIATYKKLGKDPLDPLISSITKVDEKEGAALQLVIRPIFKRDWSKVGHSVLSRVMNGEPLRRASSQFQRSRILNFVVDFLSVIMDLISGKKDEQEKDVSQKVVKAVEEKIEKPAFEVNIRFLVSAQKKYRAEQVLQNIESSMNQFSIAGSNGFSPVRVENKALQKLVYNFSFRNFVSIRKDVVLNLEEITSIFHLPTPETEVSYLDTVKSKESSIPTSLGDSDEIAIGASEFRGEKKRVHFSSKEDRRRHFYVIGQTGTGKTSLLREMIRQDMENGEGVAVIDPHGDLVEDTLANVPPERSEDVIVFEPFDTERPVGLNMLEYDTPEQKDFAVQEMISIFHELFPPEIIGPMFEHYMRNALLALMADKENPGTLVEVSKMFTDDTFMKEKLKKVTDPLVKDFWLQEWEQTTGSTKSDMLGYVVSKVGRFIENEMMRNIIGQTHSGFNLDEIMDDQKIFLANLSKGQTGEINSSLLGLILVSKMQMGVMKRASIPKEERKDFYLYIDEFQNFVTSSIATILSEARKYRLNLIMAHQYLDQIEGEVGDAVLGNTGTLGAYRVASEDAKKLENQFTPEFSQHDLANLDNFSFIVKMMIDGKTSSPFRVNALYPKEGRPNIVDKIKKLSRLKYGRPKKEVEEDIGRRLGI